MFGKNHNIKLVITNKKKNYLAFKPNYHTTKLFCENLSVTEMKKTTAVMNETVYVSFEIIDISKIPK